MTSIYLKVKDKLSNISGVMSDEECLLTLRKNYSLGEAAPQGAFLDFLNKRLPLQDGDMLSYVYSMIRGVRHNGLKVIVNSESVVIHGLYACFLDFGRVDIKYKSNFDWKNLLSECNGQYIKDFCSALNANRPISDDKGLTIIFCDSSDLDSFKLSSQEFINTHGASILLVKNLSHKNSAYLEYPFMTKNLHPYFSLMGFGAYLKI